MTSTSLSYSISSCFAHSVSKTYPQKPPLPLQTVDSALVPTLFTGAGEKASYRFIEYFTARIRNPNTRQAYFRAVNHFSQWCARHNLELTQLNPVVIAGYLEALGEELGVTSVKQHLSAIRRLFDYLVTGQIVPFNPAHAVQAPRYSQSSGKTPIPSSVRPRRVNCWSRLILPTCGGCAIGR